MFNKINKVLVVNTCKFIVAGATYIKPTVISHYVTSTLLVPTKRRTTLGDRSFPVDAARAWNALPASVRTAESYTAFRRQIKTLQFQTSFSDDWTWLCQLLLLLWLQTRHMWHCIFVIMSF